MHIDYQAAKFWLDIIQLLAIVLMWVYMLFTNRHKANRSAIDRVDARVTDIQSRLQLTEQKINHQPDDDDIERIHSRIDDVSRGVSKLEGESTQIMHTLQLIQRHLLDGKNR